MNEMIAPILKDMVNMHRNGCEEFFIIAVRPWLFCWICGFSDLLSSLISGWGFETSVLLSEAIGMLKLSYVSEAYISFCVVHF
jgi:hypothetical protein